MPSLRHLGVVKRSTAGCHGTISASVAWARTTHAVAGTVRTSQTNETCFAPAFRMFPKTQTVDANTPDTFLPKQIFGRAKHAPRFYVVEGRPTRFSSSSKWRWVWRAIMMQLSQPHKNTALIPHSDHPWRVPSVRQLAVI